MLALRASQCHDDEEGALYLQPTRIWRVFTLVEN